MAILIKRYANRKLYNTDTSRYITLKGIAELLDTGEQVTVIDNETGEDITSVALSQILVDSERSQTSPPSSLLSQILGRGGDAIYDALKRGVGEATESLDDLQDRVRKMVGTEHEGATGEGTGADPDEPGPRSWPQSIFHSPPELEKIMQASMERVFRALDLPRRSDVDALNDNLERVASAVEMLEEALAGKPARSKSSHPDQDPDEGGKS
ncbi:MAG: polyhydroxyalkanoate synthesis regulator DNA-binding domain-containing protein [Myxococcota bacterium]|nr:polyhydroxyalkanoate synthesis regulator DNA-binding domain-containing protein [Myxococcota bacterium]